MSFFFFNDTATTEIYTLSLHDALPISHARERARDERSVAADEHRMAHLAAKGRRQRREVLVLALATGDRSEEHTSELQSQSNLVCRLLLEKKKSLYILSNVHTYRVSPV